MPYDLKKLNVASLDFDNIKSSLISFLEQQTDLKNLDFRNEASAVNLLLNILSTATAYNGVYAQYGYINSFATTATVLESLLGIASNNSVLLIPTNSAACTATITTSSKLAEYSSFNARSVVNGDVFFFNTEEIAANSSKSIKLYSGSQVVSYKSYDYATQSCILPYGVNPETISFYETDITTNVTTKWTRTDKSNTAKSGNNTHYTVKNGSLGYVVTNNFASAKQITTASRVEIIAVIGNGSSGNSAVISPSSGTTINSITTPLGGYDLISINRARTSLLFKATGQSRCVTVRDYKNAILSSGIDGTNDESKITVSNGKYPGQVKVFVSGLSSNNSQQLIDNLSELTPAGITVVYEQ